MELKDFIAETIIQINQGLVEAQERTKEHGTVVNPKIERANGMYSTSIYTKGALQSIDFDICLTVENTENNEQKAGIGIVSIITGNLSNESNSKSQAVNRIKFSVPVHFPWGK